MNSDSSHDYFIGVVNAPSRHARSMRRKFVALALAAIVVSGSAFCGTLPTYVFATIAYPNAINTVVTSINNVGQISGLFNSGVIGPLGTPLSTGFVYTPNPTSPSGLFQQLPPPTDPYTNTAFASINDAGTIVGEAQRTTTTPQPTQLGYVLSGGTYTLIQGDSSHPTTALVGITNGNPALALGNESGSGNSAGLIYNTVTGASTYYSIPGNRSTGFEGANAAGVIVGSTITTGPRSDTSQFGFVYSGSGAPIQFQVNNTATFAHSINDAGLIAGEFGLQPAHTSAFVGTVTATSDTFEILDFPGATYTAAQSINDYGQIVGQYVLANSNVIGSFIGTPAYLPTGTINGQYQFDFDIAPSVEYFIDPLVATGYNYVVGAGDPLFASVLLPIGIGDSLYTLIVHGQSFLLAGGELFDFTTHGFSNGVTAFEVTGIEASAGIDPTNPQSFVTGLTFVGGGEFTGTMTPITTNVPEPATAALLCIGLAGLSFSRRKS